MAQLPNWLGISPPADAEAEGIWTRAYSKEERLTWLKRTVDPIWDQYVSIAKKRRDQCTNLYTKNLITMV